MKLALLCGWLLPSALATAFGTDSAVITAQDVRSGLTTDNLLPGAQYRVYAHYNESSHPTQGVYASHVVITGADNTSATVASLGMAGTGIYPFLDPVLMTAPITITDQNLPLTTGDMPFFPFTIYIVSTSFAVAPVVGALHDVLNVNCTRIPIITSPSCTVLSAEMDMEIYSIDMRSLDSVYVYNMGFDAAANGAQTVLAVTKSSAVDGTSVRISGPIATVYNPNGAADINFAVRGDGRWTKYLDAGARITFLSNGFLNSESSYNVDFANENVKSRENYFEKETQISFSSSIGNYFPPADTIDFTCTDGNGKKQIYDPAKGDQSNLWCKTIELHVTTTAVGGPRFMIRVESGAFSTSMFVLVIISIFGRLNQ